MPGLLSDVLPYVYSRGNALQRYMGGLLSDPVGSVQQTAGLLNDSRTEQNRLNALAFADPRQPFQVTDKNALNALIDRTMQGPMGFAPVGMTAWHGSPHVFDKFDSTKIGSGEGSQAYGHGLYLAESPEVAKTYKESNLMMSPRARMVLDDAGGDLQKAAMLAQQKAAKMPEYKAAADELAAAKPGSIYKVDLPDDKVAKMLDWDKPLSQQPEAVRAAMADARNTARYGPLQGRRLILDPSDKWTKGEDAYREITRQLTDGLVISRGSTVTGNAALTAPNYLRELGIPGVRYLDGGSRGTGGTSNFVVFPGEEAALSILERNGKPVR